MGLLASSNRVPRPTICQHLVGHQKRCQVPLFRVVTSLKTKRCNKTHRTIPLWNPLEKQLLEHYAARDSSNQFVIAEPQLRRPQANLRTTFHRICETTGIAEIKNPFRNMRRSAANDVCRADYPMKTVTEWFGHDITTALKHYHRVMESDFQLARQGDPFADRSKSHPKKGDVKSDVSTPENGVEQGSREKKSPAISLIAGHKCAHSDPYGVRKTCKTIGVSAIITTK